MKCLLLVSNKFKTSVLEPKNCVWRKRLWRGRRERAPIAVNRLGCTTSELLWSVDLYSYRFQLSFICGYFHASFPHHHWMKQELRHTSPFLKAVVGRGLLTSSRAPTIQSRRGHQCGVSKGSALRLRLTGSVVQPRWPARLWAMICWLIKLSVPIIFHLWLLPC